MSKPQFTEKCSTDRNNSDDYVNDHSFHDYQQKKNVFNESVIPCSILVPRAFWRGREKALGTRMTVLMSNSYLNIVH